VCVFFIGFVAAIPVGATQIETARRAIQGFLGSALAVVAGSVTSDLIYGAIALFGISVFLQKPEVEAVFWLINGIITIILGIAAIRESRLKVRRGGPKRDPVAESRDLNRLRNPRLAYVTGFSLAFTNPMMIAWWLLAGKLLADLGLVGTYTNTTRVLFLISGGLGLGSYLTLLAFLTRRAHKSLSRKKAKNVTLGFGVAMVLLAIYFFVRAILLIVALM
jgi:threonine/homoserine/homoserine lactone efflux protein